MNKPNTIPNIKITDFRKFGKSTHNESGAALVIVLLLLLVLAGLVPAAVNMARNDFVRTTSYEEGKESFYIADTGIENAKRLMKNQYKTDFLDDGLLEPGGTVVTGTNNKTYTDVLELGVQYNEYSYGGGKYWIRVDDNVEADGVPTADTDNMIVVTSIGQVDDARTAKTIKATTWKMDLPPQNFPSALTMVGPTSVLNTNGASFGVKGADPTTKKGYKADGTTIDSACTGKNAVSFESNTGGSPDTADCVNAADAGCSKKTSCDVSTSATCIVDSGNSGKNFANYQGTGGTSGDFVQGQTNFSSQDGRELWELMTDDADGKNGPDLTSAKCPGTTDGSCYEAGGGTVKVTGETWGSTANPVFAYIPGNAELSITGTGILVVDGDFQISGAFNWTGIILVGVCPTCSSTANDASGAGNGSINGAFVVGNGKKAQVNMSGSISINYSCEGIAYANQVFAGSVNVVAWNEVGA